MSDTPDEIFDCMREALERPTFCGTPQLAEGIALGLAAAWLRQHQDVSFDVAFQKVFALVGDACVEVVRPPSKAAFLSDEASVVGRSPSFDAVRRHGKIFMELLHGLE